MIKQAWKTLMDVSNQIEFVRKTKLNIRVLFGSQIRPGIDLECSSTVLGDNYRVAWAIHAEPLNDESIVYSLGVGKDISFDLELIRRFGVRVHAFDPTPVTSKWIHEQTLPSQFIYFEEGIMASEGIVSMQSPREDAGDTSHSIVRDQDATDADLKVPVTTLPNVMKRFGHTRIDLLKMDIEGAEYEVLEALIDSQIDVRQLLVEFHHRWSDLGQEKTLSILKKLRAYGFKVFAVSGLGDEYSMLRTSV